jgi:hypothetical protein
LRAHKDDPRCPAFVEKWVGLLGNEDRFWDEYEKYERWLKKWPKKRANVKSFDLSFGNWLRKEVDDG